MKNKRREALQLLTPTESTDACVTELSWNFLERNTIKENFFANLRQLRRKPHPIQSHAAGKGGVKV